VITVKNLHKKFGHLHILKGIDLEISQGEVVVVIGPSGSGKSTFLRCLNMLETPSEGEILFEGESITARGHNINLTRQKMGMVFQQFNLFPHKTVLDNITLAPIRVKKMEKNKAEAVAMDLLQTVGLQDKRDAYPSQLSGGQKQRIAIARIFLKNPPILILDEATSALDTETERAIQQSLADLSEGRTTLVIAHRLATITNADRIVVVEDGQITEQGDHSELVARKDGRYQKLHRAQHGVAIIVAYDEIMPAASFVDEL